MKNILGNKVSRVQYTIIYILLVVAFILYEMNLFTLIELIDNESIFKLLSLGIIIIMSITLLFFMNGRLNDMGKPRWYLIFAFVPIVNTIFGIVLCFYPPTKLPNLSNQQKT